MIVAERKPIKEILNMIADFKKILILGCNGCVAVCSAGGQKEVEILASVIRMARKREGRPIEIEEKTIGRQCDAKFFGPLEVLVDSCDAILSMACGVGVNLLAETFTETIVLPALNTSFMGITEEQGVWSERCAGCGNCILDKTAGLCPIARCPKQLLNGPCGGSVGGKCEVDPEIDCVWQLIYDRLKRLNQLDKLEEILPIKDWSTAGHGGPRKIVREDLKI